MTDLYAKGEEVCSEKIRYCFGSIPDSANRSGQRFCGTFKNKGWAREVPTLRRSPDGKPAGVTAIHSETAYFECDKRPRFPGKTKTCGSHTCKTGLIKGAALARIQTPFRHHAEAAGR